MGEVKEYAVKYRIPLIVALIQWFLTALFQLDRKFFVYEEETKYFLIVKAAYFIFLIATWCFVFHVYKEYKAYNDKYRRGVQVFVVYFIVMLVLLLILWPGTWSWDDIGILIEIKNYSSFVAWQHILSGGYQALLLQMFPFPGGIILIQNVIIAICVAFSVVKLESGFKIKKFSNQVLDMGVKLFPFLLPPVLLYQFSGYRMGIYVYLELVMLIMIICGEQDRDEWSWKKTVLFGFLVILMASWRTESLFYVFIMPILLVALSKKLLPVRKKMFCILFIFIGFMCINKIQNRALGNSNYEVISLMGPYAAVVRVADYREDAECLDAIDKVANIELIHNNPDMGGEALYWGAHAYRDDYNSEDLKESIIALAKLSIKYPGAVITERWNMFIKASGITGAAWRINWQSSILFDQDDSSSYDEAFKESGWLPVFKQGRKALINILSCNKISGEQISVMRRLVWNALIPITILVYAWLHLMINKKWFLLGVSTSVVIRIPIVILTEPAGWLMYFLSFYFLGYVYLVYRILIVVSRNEGNEKNG